MTKGWRNEPYRHDMARKGIRTGKLHIPAMGIEKQYETLLESFPESKTTDVRSTVYYMGATHDKDDWSYKYGYFGSVWNEPENIKDNEWLINLQRQALIELDLNKTHVKIGEVPFSNPEEIYYEMQGEMWSPNGEARSLISKSKTQHTSMSIGDLIKTPDGKLLIVAGVGFLDVDNLKIWHGLK